MAQLPIRPFNAERAARNWRLDLNATAGSPMTRSGRAAMLKLPPVKQVMASRQVKSRYLERLVASN